MNETLKTLMTRRSCKKFKPDQIKDEELDYILKAGINAPTGRGLQSPIIIVIQDKDTIKKIAKEKEKKEKGKRYGKEKKKRKKFF